MSLRLASRADACNEQEDQMDQTHLPDLAHAPTWLREIANDLKALANHSGRYKWSDHAATLDDVATRAVFTSAPHPQSREFFDAAVANMTGEQALALLRRIKPGDPTPTLEWEPFDLPPGYVLARYADGFECGIDSEGSVSS